jgi:UDP-glucuronate 4-epimerase
MKILVTGCAGFIGSHVTERLLKEGHAVTGIDNFDAFYDKSLKLKNLELFLNHPGFEFIEADLSEQNLSQILASKIEMVIHLAAKVGVRPSIEQPQAYIKANIIATQNVLNWMQIAGIKKLIFASSSSVYGNNCKIPFSETDNTDFPISPYAFTKKACELITYNYHHLYQIDVVNLRFFTVYGPRQRPDLAIRKFFELVANDQPITLFGDGNTGRDYTFVEDTVQGIWKATQYLQKNENVYETINLGNSTPVKLTELVEQIYSIAGKKPNIVYAPMQAGDVELTYADISKAEKLLGYSPQTNLAEGLKKVYKWLKDME